MDEGGVQEPLFVQERARPVLQEALSTRYWRLVLRSPQIARLARPGQFILLSCRPVEPLATDPLLGRPLALMDADPAAGTLELLYFCAGRGTSILNESVLRVLAGAGQGQWQVLGPFGNGFHPIEEVAAYVGVGGGSGVAPLVFFFRRLAGDPTVPRKPIHLIIGARQAGQLPRMDFSRLPQTVLWPATEDGSAGFKGNAVEAAAHLLDGPLREIKAGLFVAGPDPMMRAAAVLARQKGLLCRVSLESRMACGVGVCRSCVTDVRTPHPKTGLFRRTVCQDGPVFDPTGLSETWWSGG